jgi:hypothetical protein
MPSTVFRVIDENWIETRCKCGEVIKGSRLGFIETWQGGGFTLGHGDKECPVTAEETKQLHSQLGGQCDCGDDECEIGRTDKLERDRLYDAAMATWSNS